MKNSNEAVTLKPAAEFRASSGRCVAGKQLFAPAAGDFVKHYAAEQRACYRQSRAYQGAGRRGDCKHQQKRVGAAGVGDACGFH